MLSVETREVREVARNLWGMAKPAGPDWKRIPPERRGRWGRFLVEQRFAHGDLTQVAVRDMLAKMGEEISGPYYSEFETGKTVPNPYWRAVFTRLWNAAPDEEEALSVAPTPPVDVPALLRAIEQQQRDIAELRGMVKDLVGLIHQDRKDPPWWVNILAAQGKAITIALGLDVEDAKK